MKKIVTLLALCICITASAESRRLLTMEEAILSRELIPQNYSVVWSASHPNHFLHYSDSEWSAVNIHTGEASPATAPSKPKAQFKTVENNIVRIMDDGTERKVTNFADPNIVAGGSVSRNEFGIDGGLFLSPNGEMLAFYQKDESRVSTFPLLDITTRTGTLKQIKYPMNSMASEVVSVGVYNLATESITYLSVTDFDSEQYLTNLTWSPDSSTIYLQVLDRAQKNMHLNAYNATTGEFIRT
ncbi:MAG: DPP IV N-terminal domain-containing protein, partial [Alistipes sp.]|nr:DPP IV N-terminal domain-containing protein [Alistipes sp.]